VGFLKNGIPSPRFIWLHNDKDAIIALYNSVYRGYMNYYSFVFNFSRLASMLHFTLLTSCAKAAKFKLKTLQLQQVFFGKRLKGEDRIEFVKADYKMNPWNFHINIKESISSLYAETISSASLRNLKCAVCQSDYRVEMHHIRMMKDLNPYSLMVKRKRKQIPLCRKCHIEYHNKGNKG
jgi:hypothetical protein